MGQFLGHHFHSTKVKNPKQSHKHLPQKHCGGMGIFVTTLYPGLFTYTCHTQKTIGTRLCL